MASLSLDGSGSIGVRAPAQEKSQEAAATGRLGKLWSIVRMIYKNDFTRYVHAVLL